MLLFFVFIFSIYFVFDSADAGHLIPCNPGEVQIGDYCYACEASSSDTVCPNDFVPGTCTDSNPDYDCVAYTQCADRTESTCKVATSSQGDCQLCPLCEGSEPSAFLFGSQCRLAKSSCNYKKDDTNPNYVKGQCGVNCVQQLGPNEAECGTQPCAAPHTVGSCVQSCNNFQCATDCQLSCSCESGWKDTNPSIAGCETPVSDVCSERSDGNCQIDNKCILCKDCVNRQYSGGLTPCIDNKPGACTRAYVVNQCGAECIPGQTQDTGVDYCSAGNINNQILGCKEGLWDDATAADSSQSCVDSCTDTDAGVDFVNKGIVTDNNKCSSGSVCPSSSSVDSCSGNSVVEYSCSGNDAISTTKNCNDYDNVNVDPAQNICSWSDGNCGNGACNVLQGSVDCDVYANGDNVVSSEATLSSCSVGCTNENCCKITKRFFTGCLNDGTQSGKLDVCENGNCVTISTNEQETCSSGGCCYPSGGNSICKNSGTIMSVDNDVYTEICSAGDWKGANCVGAGCIDDGFGQNVNYECVTASDCNLNAGECGQVACINNICITQAKSDAKQVCEGIASSKGFECAAYLKCDNKIGVGYNCNFIGQSTLCGQKGFGFDTGCSDKPDFKCNQALCLDPVQNPCKLCYSQCLEAANDPNRQPVSSEECEPPNGYWALCGG